MLSKKLSIIIASYNDARIAGAIASARKFDDIGAVRLVVIDGGSRSEVRNLIADLLTPDDIFISESDRGIFDALNKGLDNCHTDYIGWLGSDDLFSGHVLASEVVRALETHDLFIANTVHFKGTRILRVSHAFPARLGLVRFGLNNPHYSTFGRASLLKSARFDIDLLGSDIEYFQKIFGHRPRVASTSRVSTLMLAGGFSNSSYKHVVRINWQLLSIYARYNSPLLAPAALFLKVGYKALTVIQAKLWPKDIAWLEAQASRRQLPR